MSSSKDIKEAQDNTYWNRPAGRGRTRQRKSRPRSLSPTAMESLPKNLKFASRAPTKRKTKSPPKKNSKSPTREQQTSKLKTPPKRAPLTQEKPQETSANFQRFYGRSPSPPSINGLTLARKKQEEDDEKDEKAIVKLMKSTLPKFSNQVDWEVAMFELSLVLDRVWPYKDQMDIIEYINDQWINYYPQYLEERADRIVYFALTLAAEKDSYAKLQIVAACHIEAIPCVMKNQGKKLYHMFLSLFTMTNLHQASLPNVRKQFYEVRQKENESILKYTSRVDMIVATLAKLGEKVTTSAWIYAMGNGLLPEFKESRNGILYNKQGFSTVLQVKTHILSEEAILNSNNKRHETNTKENETEIDLKHSEHDDKKSKQEEVSLSSTNKGGKKGKGKSKNRNSSKGNRNWNQETDNWSNYNQNWTENWQQTYNDKGKGKPNYNKGKTPNAQELWCDIHQKYGHSTDWCFNNPNRTGGKPANNHWCDIHQKYGHSTDWCFENPNRTGGKGQQQQKGKGTHPNNAIGKGKA